MKRLVVLAGMAAVLVGVAACNSPTPGNPTSTSGNGQPSDSQPASPSSSMAGPALPVNDPCSLISSSDLEQLGASSPPSKDKVGGAPDCSIDTSSGNIGVTVLAHRGLAQLNVQGPVTDRKVGSHQVKQMQYTSDSSDCLVAIGVTSSSRVDVSFEANGGVDACSNAFKAAQLVEPHLPASSG